MSFNETQRNQIDVLIEQKRQEISNLEDSKKDYEGDEDEVTEVRTPAVVAADPNASSEERAAAANAVLGQSPETVNAEQSAPSPSTHAEQYGTEAEADKAADEEQAKEEAKDTEADAGETVPPLPDGRVPDGRGDANELGAAGQVEGAGADVGDNPDRQEHTEDHSDDKKSSKKGSNKKS